MGQEVGSYVADLVATNPIAGSDTVSGGPAQFQFIKSVLKKSFPGFTGAVAAAGTTTGSANAYVLTPTTALVSYKHGMVVFVRANFTNTGAATLNISALGAKTIKTLAGADVVSGDIVSGQFIALIYDETAGYFVCHSGLAISGGAAVTPVLLATLTASTSASLIDTTSLTSTYKSYLFRFINVRGASAAILQAQVSIDGGANWKSDSAYSHVFCDTTGSPLSVAGVAFTGTAISVDNSGVSTAAKGGTVGQMVLTNPSSSTTNKRILVSTAFYNGTAEEVWVGSVVYTGSTAAINAIKFFESTGNIADGSIEIWGYK